MKRFLICTSLFLSIGSDAPLLAQPYEGNQEFSLAANHITPEEGSSIAGGEASYGYYIYRPLELGIRQSFSEGIDGVTSGNWNGVTAPFVNLHLTYEDETIVPYLGAFVGAVWNDNQDNGALGPQAGVKIFFSGATFLALNYRYEWYFDGVGNADNTDHAYHIAGVGLGFTWDREAGQGQSRRAPPGRGRQL